MRGKKARQIRQMARGGCDPAKCYRTRDGQTGAIRHLTGGYRQTYQSLKRMFGKGIRLF